MVKGWSVFALLIGWLVTFQCSSEPNDNGLFVDGLRVAIVKGKLVCPIPGRAHAAGPVSVELDRNASTFA